MKFWLIFLSVVVLTGCRSSKPIQPTNPLAQFEDAYFGVRFKHSDALSISYNPDGAINEAIMSYQKKTIGSLGIHSGVPEGRFKDLIVASIDYIKSEFGASTVEYRTYENPNNIKFHHLKARITQKGSEYIIERFFYLRTAKEMSGLEPTLAKLSGAFSFQFRVPIDNYQKVKPETQTVIDTFRIESPNKSGLEQPATPSTSP